MNDFYIFLSSNIESEFSSQKHNSIGNFRTNLPYKIELSDEYQVAISDIGYTRSWYNIEEDEKMDIQTNSTTEKIQCILPAGYYKDRESLRKAINESIFKETYNVKSITVPPYLLFDDTKQRFILVFGSAADTKIKDYYYIYFSKYLSNLLGFVDEEIGIFNSVNFEKFRIQNISMNNKNKTRIAPYLCASNIPQLQIINSIYVYSDLIKPVIVGNNRAQLMRHVEVPKGIDFKDNFFINFRDRFYHPLNHCEFDTINITLKDDKGKIIDFKEGCATITLHFKKVDRFESIINELLK